jgi:hypothetical protein
MNMIPQEKLVLALLLALAISQFGFGQVERTEVSERKRLSKIEHADRSTFRYIPKRPGHYTAEDWRAVIDSTWGVGLSTATKLLIFDLFWNDIDTKYPSFFNLNVNWDSLKSVYRPEIEAGVSRGRFAAIMSRMSSMLSDMHTHVADRPLATDSLKPGTPIFVVSGYQSMYDREMLSQEYCHFGASLSLLPDSSLLVYDAVPNHPLGLERGDIILGYDGFPWKMLYKELLAAELPFRYSGTIGSNTRSMTHLLLTSAGENWHLFDTIDVIKYATMDTVHLATAPLQGEKMKLYATSQMPIAGIPFPDIDHGHWVSWGVIDGTTIGYIYVWNWTSNGDFPYPTTPTGVDFRSAIQTLIEDYGISGLIIDSRYNTGGQFWECAEGMKILFNEDQDIFEGDCRYRGDDHYSMTHYYGPTGGISKFAATQYLFDRPIAVLTSPFSISCGDFMPLQMRYHPMVRTFGLGTNGAFGTVGEVNLPGISDDWIYVRAMSNFRLKDEPDKYLTHRDFPPDEEVWFDPDDVAKGDDTVVKRAVAWITSVSYAHDVKVIWSDSPAVTPAQSGIMYAASDSLYTIDVQSGTMETIGWIGPQAVDGMAVRPSTGEIYAVSGTPLNTQLYRISVSGAQQLAAAIPTDSIHITATVENPLHHSLFVSAIITDAEGSVVDSVTLTSDPGDTMWGVLIATPATTGRYDVSVRTDDMTAGTSRRLQRVAWFSSLTRVERTIPIPNVAAIAFSSEDVLYGATSSGCLYRIDLATGNTDSVGTMQGLVYSGLSFRPQTNDLWASVRHPTDSIFTVNTENGLATFVGITGFNALTASIAFGSTGALFGLIDNGSGEDYLASLDTHSGAGSLIAGPLSANHLQALVMLPVVGSVDERRESDIPLTCSLDQNYPNPFNPVTNIRFSIIPPGGRAENSQLTILRVYDLLGREVATLVNEVMQPGTYTVQWDATNLASGVYFYRLNAGDFAAVKRMMLIR